MDGKIHDMIHGRRTPAEGSVGDVLNPVLQKQDVEIIRFALSFLSANLYDAVFADFDSDAAIERTDTEDINAMDWTGTESELAVRVQDLHTMFESENE
jgi:hypothetical protein|tara:strand:- start:44 stop:337 length:294 start_codon:yes stop_codon:yes gene_type:complete